MLGTRETAMHSAASLCYGSLTELSVLRLAMTCDCSCCRHEDPATNPRICVTSFGARLLRQK